MERCFNIAGPCFPDEHYMLPALERLPGIMLGPPEGWMAVFDEDSGRSWDEKIYSRDVAFDGKTLHIVGL